MCTNSSQNARLSMTDLVPPHQRPKSMSFFERLETMNGWQAFWRPAIAYCLASYVAAIVPLLLLLRVSDDGLATQAIWVVQALIFGVFPAILVASIAFVPTIVAAVVLHETHLRRGIAEAVIGGVLGPPVLLFSFLGLGLIWAGTGSTLLGRFALSGIWGLLAATVAAGATAGLTYWLAVGRPENPRAR